MSISEFKKSLQTKAGQQVAEKMLQDFVDSSTARFKQGGISRDASILTQGTSGKVNLSEAFRDSGMVQGRTRLVITKDFLIEMFKELNITSNDTPPMAQYIDFLKNTYGNKYKAKHFEVYKADGSVQEYAKNSKVELGEALAGAEQETIAIRGLNFSHTNTLTHIAHFLVYIKKCANIKDAELLLSSKYERGHVYAQTTGRALASLNNADNILSKIVELSAFLDEESSSLRRTKDNDNYAEVRARAKKDFTAKQLYMNIELQLKKGNQDTGKISSLLRIVGTLQKLVDTVQTSRDGKRLLSTPKAASLSTLGKQLDSFLKKLEKTDTAAAQEMAKIVSQSSDPSFLVDLRTSKSAKEYIRDILVETITSGKSTNTVKTDTGFITSKTFKAPRAPSIPSAKEIAAEAAAVQRKVKQVKKDIERPVQLRTLKGQFTNPASLQLLLNSALTQQIRKNMGTGNRRDILNYRTGRFAESARVENVSVSREGMITAFYSYMKYPYQTFEPGFKQGSPKTRDPKLLISKSIREIAAGLVGNKLRAVRL
jgi:hypothetical protein